MKKRPQIKTTKSLNVSENPKSVSPASSSLLENREIYYQNVQNALGFFTDKNAPSSYDELKKEIKVLERVHAQSFLILSHRLKIIKDKELYKEDGYKDFKSFVENELDLTRSIVYGYIRVLETFGVFPEIHEQQVKITSLMRVAVLAQEYPQEAKVFFDKANTLSRRELENWLREKYPAKRKSNLKEDDKNSSIDWYDTEEELINHSKIIREGMKFKTVKRDGQDIINWLLLNDPTNKALRKIKDLWEKV